MDNTHEQWENELATRESNLAALRKARQEVPGLRNSARRLRGHIHHLLRPLIQQWQQSMKQARRPSAAQIGLQRELRRAKWAHPRRHWAGLLTRLEILFLQISRGLIVLLAVLLVAALIFSIVTLAILAWRRFII